MSLKNIRTERNISQAALASISNVPQQVISDIESGKVRNPRIETVMKLCKALDVSIDEMMKGDTDDGR